MEGQATSDEYLRNGCLFSRCWDFQDFYIFSCSVFGFGIVVMLVSNNELGSIPSSSIFWNSLYKSGIVSSLNVW